MNEIHINVWNVKAIQLFIWFLKVKTLKKQLMCNIAMWVCIDYFNPWTDTKLLLKDKYLLLPISQLMQMHLFTDILCIVSILQSPREQTHTEESRNWHCSESFSMVSSVRSAHLVLSFLTICCAHSRYQEIVICILYE